MTKALRLAILTSSDVAGAVPTSDVVVTGDPTMALVADLAELVGFPRGPLLIDDRRFTGSAALTETNIHDGSTIANPADLVRPEMADLGEPLITIKTIAGAFTGRTQSLGPGTYSRAIHDPVWSPASRQDAETILTLTVPAPNEQSRRVGRPLGTVGDGLAVTVVPGVRPVAIGGTVLTGPTPLEPTEAATILNLGTERMAVTAFVPAELRQRKTETALHRVPRIAHLAAEPILHTSMIPSPPGERPGLSWITMLAPIPMALIMALVIGRRALIFCLVSPVMVLAKLWENRRTHTRKTEEYEAGVAAARIDFYHQVVAARSAAIDHARALNRGAGELVDRALTTDPRLWERRPGHSDFGTLAVGFADLPWRYQPRTPAGQYARIPTELMDISDGFNYLPSVPVAVDLRLGSLGIVGSRAAALAAARGVVVALATLSGPADIPLALISREEDLDEWDWAKWLPHLGTPNRLGSSRADIDAIIARRAVDFDRCSGQVPSPHPLSVLIIDGVEQLRRPDSSLRRGLSERNGIAGIVIAESQDDLPASCNWVLAIDDEGMASLIDMSTGTTTVHITPVGMDPLIAASAARSMARLIDPDIAASAIDLPKSASLPTLIGAIEAEAVLGRWECADLDANPVATIGVDPSGPLLIDLVRDGPHALLAGTTGAGKSEFLRSFVLSLATRLSPEQINFVLVDYKGGGAFDACAELPHSVAMVTDLDGHLGARALRSLQAELRFREITFRDAGAHDLSGFRTGGGVMPRLIVVVDEFATLAAELPDFLDALVDIAQRGRSLGIHMVLATQRPAGVVDAKIRANTNLRISLRVQDDNDSMDVIGTNQAARLGRSETGRGFVRMGASEIIPFQAAYSGGVTPAATLTTGISIAGFRLRPDRRTLTGPASSGTPAGTPSDMKRMVAEIVLANDKADLADPRRPWLPELPAVFPLAELRQVVAETSRGLATIGLLDVPAEQRRAPLRVDASAGNTVIYGADQSTTSATLRVLGLQLLSGVTPDDLHLYLLDSAPAGLRDLRNAPHVGVHIPHEDDELLGRMLDLLEGLLLERKAARSDGGELDDLPLTVVLVDGFGSLLERLGDGADHATLSRFGALLRNGPNLGISLIGTASHDRQISGRLASQIHTKLVHQLTDPSAIVSFGLRPKDLPALAGSMIIEVATGLDGVVAAVSSEEIAAIVASVPPATHRAPRRLRILRPIVDAADLGARPASDGRKLRLPIGVRIRDVETATLTVEDRAVILGQSGTGRTSALVQLAKQAGKVLPPGSIVVIANAQSPLAKIEGVRALAPDRALEENERASLAESVLLVIDDAERLDRGLGFQLRAYVENLRPGRWVLAAMRPGDLKAMGEWTSVFRGANVGVLLRPQATDGDSLRVMLVNRMVRDLRQGQGILVENGEATPIQLAMEHGEVLDGGSLRAQ